MRLLDAPIRKQAADLTDEQRRNMIRDILIGAGGGAGVGGLTQYLMTGKVGLSGLGLGAAGGIFWALQYHPEYDLHELARLCYCRKKYRPYA